VKHLIPPLAALLALAAVPAVSAAATRLALLDADSEVVDVADMASLQRTGDHVRINTATIYAKLQTSSSGKQFVYAEANWEVDCASNRVATMGITARDESFAITLQASQDGEPQPDDWAEVKPNTTGALIVKAACTPESIASAKALPSDLRAIRASYYP
jgi:hypothetical protein